jgi:hypothetical protein
MVMAAGPRPLGGLHPGPAAVVDGGREQGLQPHLPPSEALPLPLLLLPPLLLLARVVPWLLQVLVAAGVVTAATSLWGRCCHLAAVHCLASQRPRMALPQGPA